MPESTLIFPHQLFRPHPAVARGRRIALIEDSLFFGDPVWPATLHRHKLILHRASLASFAAELKKTGHAPDHLPYRPGETLREQLGPWLAKHAVDTVHVCELDDDILDRRLRRLAAERGIRIVSHPSPMFLAPVADSPSPLSPSGEYRMASFYIRQRNAHRILVDSQGKPVGGQWSFDADNRKRWPKGRDEPVRWMPPMRPETRQAIREIEREFPDHPGHPDAFAYPVTRADAERQLDDFLEHRFAGFGDFEDAISTTHRVMHHAVLTPALNIGLLTPRQVLDRALAAAEDGKVPLNALEGFFRQILGWREFMRMVYHREGVRQRTANFWNHRNPMPPAFYTGTTGLPPFDLVVRNLLDHAYAHHIERLMVLGNLMLLCRIHPDAVYRWFMELFIDAYDWVMVPNVYGMSQFADGGLITTKPYLSGSNYLRKMSDHAAGDWCATWDGLYWTFVDDHRDFFATQPRLGMMTRQLDRMSAEVRKGHRRQAEAFWARMGIG